MYSVIRRRRAVALPPREFILTLCPRERLKVIAGDRSGESEREQSEMGVVQDEVDADRVAESSRTVATAWSGQGPAIYWYPAHRRHRPSAAVRAATPPVLYTHNTAWTDTQGTPERVWPVLHAGKTAFASNSFGMRSGACGLLDTQLRPVLTLGRPDVVESSRDPTLRPRQINLTHARCGRNKQKTILVWRTSEHGTSGP